jgi:hypothetical protein
VKLVRLRNFSTRILQRCTHGAIARACFIWYQLSAKSMRDARKMFKIASRWSKMHCAQAFGSWHNVSATNKQIARKLQKMVPRRDKIKYAEAFGSWHAQTKAKRKLGIAATRVVKRSANKALAMAWGSWWGSWSRGEVRVARKLSLKWMHKAICAAWTRWETRVQEKELRRQKLRQKEVLALDTAVKETEARLDWQFTCVTSTKVQILSQIQEAQANLRKYQEEVEGEQKAAAERAAAHILWSSVETALQQALQQAEAERVAPYMLLESELHSSTARNQRCSAP